MTRRNSKFDTKIKNDFRRRKRPSSDSKVTLKGSKSKNDGNYRKKLHKFQIIGSRNYYNRMSEKISGHWLKSKK